MAAVSLRPSAQRDSYSAFQPFSATGTVASAFTQRSADGRQLCRRGEKAARYGQILDHVTSSCWFGLEYHQIRVQRSNHAEDAPGISQVTASISTYQADKENAHASKAAETHRHVSKVIQECNWLQGLEGGLDTSHAPILHRLLKDDVGRDGIKPSNPYVRAGAPRLVVDITDYGYQYTGIRRLGMPKCTRAPTITFCRQIRAASNAVGDWGDAGHAWVPIDDETTMVYNSVYTRKSAPLSDEDRLERAIGNGREHVDQTTFRSKANRDNAYLIERAVQKTETFTGIDGINVQDRAIQESMGPICDRSKEHLGPADKGIIQMRRLLREAINTVRAGCTPAGIGPSYYDLYCALQVLPRNANWRQILAPDIAPEKILQTV